MNRVHPLLSRTVLVMIACAALLLGACSSGVKGEIATKNVAKDFDLTVQAYKSGQFLLDGAVLSAVDLSGHFAYLKDRGRLPRTVLLERSDDAKIHKQHLLAMARMQLDYGFEVFFDKGGKLRRIDVTNKKDIPQLQEYKKAAPLPDENEGKSARGGDHFPGSGG